MSIAQDLRTRAKHRGMTPWQLVQKIGRLQRAADAKDCELMAQATRIDELTDERNRLEAQLDEAGIDYTGALDDLRQAREDADEWRGRFLALQARFGPQLAAEANANRINVPPMVRDTTAIEDQATGPINVTALWDARDAGLLGPVSDPAGVHAEGVV